MGNAGLNGVDGPTAAILAQLDANINNGIDYSRMCPTVYYDATEYEDCDNIDTPERQCTALVFHSWNRDAPYGDNGINQPQANMPAPNRYCIVRRCRNNQADPVVGREFCPFHITFYGNDPNIELLKWVEVADIDINGPVSDIIKGKISYLIGGRNFDIEDAETGVEYLDEDIGNLMRDQLCNTDTNRSTKEAAHYRDTLQQLMRMVQVEHRNALAAIIAQCGRGGDGGAALRPQLRDYERRMNRYRRERNNFRALLLRVQQQLNADRMPGETHLDLDDPNHIDWGAIPDNTAEVVRQYYLLQNKIAQTEENARIMTTFSIHRMLNTMRQLGIQNDQINELHRRYQEAARDYNDPFVRLFNLSVADKNTLRAIPERERATEAQMAGHLVDFIRQKIRRGEWIIVDRTGPDYGDGTFYRHIMGGGVRNPNILHQFAEVARGDARKPYIAVFPNKRQARTVCYQGRNGEPGQRRGDPALIDPQRFDANENGHTNCLEDINIWNSARENGVLQIQANLVDGVNIEGQGRPLKGVITENLFRTIYPDIQEILGGPDLPDNNDDADDAMDVEDEDEVGGGGEDDGDQDAMEEEEDDDGERKQPEEKNDRFERAYRFVNGLQNIWDRLNDRTKVYWRSLFRGTGEPAYERDQNFIADYNAAREDQDELNRVLPNWANILLIGQAPNFDQAASGSVAAQNKPQEELQDVFQVYNDANGRSIDINNRPTKKKRKK